MGKQGEKNIQDKDKKRKEKYSSIKKKIGKNSSFGILKTPKKWKNKGETNIQKIKEKYSSI